MKINIFKKIQTPSKLYARCSSDGVWIFQKYSFSRSTEVFKCYTFFTFSLSGSTVTSPRKMWKIGQIFYWNFACCMSMWVLRVNCFHLKYRHHPLGNRLCSASAASPPLEVWLLWLVYVKRRPCTANVGHCRWRGRCWYTLVNPRRSPTTLWPPQQSPL